MAIFNLIIGIATKGAADAARTLPTTGAGTLSTQVQIFGWGAGALGSAGHAAAHGMSPENALTSVAIGLGVSDTHIQMKQDAIGTGRR